MSELPTPTGWTDAAARRLLRNMFGAAVASADPAAAVLRHLPQKPRDRCGTEDAAGAFVTLGTRPLGGARFTRLFRSA